MLRNFLNEKITRNRLSVRAAAREIGVSHTTLNRVLEGSQLDLDTFIKFCEWLNVRPATMLGMETGNTLEILNEFPELRDALTDASRMIAEGRASSDFIRDVEAYIRFKVNQIEQASRNSTA